MIITPSHNTEPGLKTNENGGTVDVLPPPLSSRGGGTTIVTPASEDPNNVNVISSATVLGRLVHRVMTGMSSPIVRTCHNDNNVRINNVDTTVIERTEGETTEDNAQEAEQEEVQQEAQEREPEDCYLSLPCFHDYREICDPRHYRSLPRDWIVLIADVAGSTEYVESGRYRDVNTVGAMPIAAVQIALGHDDNFPYVFGGDGATLVVRAAQRETAVAALLAVQRLVATNYQMHLRIGGVTVATLQELGATVQVAKLEIAPRTVIALFSGRGLALADEMVKNGTADAALVVLSPPSSSLIATIRHGGNGRNCLDGNNSNEPDLTGLSCRWKKIPNRNGCVLSLLVSTWPRNNSNSDQFVATTTTTTTATAEQFRATTVDDDDERKIYQEVLEKLSHIIALSDDPAARSISSSGSGISGSSSNPANMDLAEYKSLTEMLCEERRMHAKQNVTLLGSIAWCIRMVEIYVCHVLFNWHGLSSRTKKMLLLDVPTYKTNMRAHADHRKFDDMIRMVVDCSDQQAVQIQTLLDELHEQGKICYGLHRSDHSLLTCLVEDAPKGRHVHFVDGDAGGYTLAAKQLKLQLKTVKDGKACRREWR